MKKITIEEYFESLMKNEGSNNELEFIKMQRKIYKTIGEDCNKLARTLETSESKPPTDFVFMIYFRMLWSKIEIAYDFDDKALENLRLLITKIMIDNSEIDEQEDDTSYGHTLN